MEKRERRKREGGVCWKFIKLVVVVTVVEFASSSTFSKTYLVGSIWSYALRNGNAAGGTDTSAGSWRLIFFRVIFGSEDQTERAGSKSLESDSAPVTVLLVP